MPVFPGSIVALPLALALMACVASSQAQRHGMRKGGHLLRSSTVFSDQIGPCAAEKHGNHASLQPGCAQCAGASGAAARQAPLSQQP